jgi:hypothetical protein
MSRSSSAVYDQGMTAALLPENYPTISAQDVFSVADDFHYFNDMHTFEKLIGLVRIMVDMFDRLAARGRYPSLLWRCVTSKVYCSHLSTQAKTNAIHCSELTSVDELHEA